jgi:DNA polymerase I
MAPPVSGGAVRLPEPPALYLIDGYALIYRAFFAMLSRPLTTARGENTSAAWGVANFLHRLRSRYHPAYVAWVNDSGLSFRHEVYPDYKATREKLTDELQADFQLGISRIEQILTAFRVPAVTVPGFEADDVIATLTRQAVERDIPAVIVSGDKDFQQLVRPGVWLLNPGRGGSAGVEESWVGLENADERLGVAPVRVTDYLALVGDSSDNVPGVPGIGDKTARELVQQFGDLESILAAAPELTKKRPREALVTHADRARLSKQLVTIRTDVPADLDLESLQVAAPDFAHLRRLFLELEFSTLLRELDDETEPEPAAAAATRYAVVDQVDALRTLAERIRELGSLTLEVQTVPEPGSPSLLDPLRTRVVGISIALTPGEAYYLPFAHREESKPEQGDLIPPIAAVQTELVSTENGEERSDEAATAESATAESATAAASPATTGKSRAKTDGMGLAARMLAERRYVPRNLPPLLSAELKPLREVLADPAIRKTSQHSKFDLLALRRAGIPVHGLEFDTMLASYVLDPGRRSHGLDLLALEFLNHRMMTYEDLCGRGKQALPFDVVPAEAARDYSCEDADITLRLRHIFAMQLESQGLSTLFHDVEMPLVHVLMDMEQAGVAIDVAWFRSLKERFQRERERVEQEIYAAAGEHFNINSNLQLRTILFEKLGLPIRKRTSTGPSTDASVLQELADEGHTLPSLLMEYRELSKLESTYLDTLPALVNPEDRRLHTSYNQTVAATGRLSSSDPNLQNIPVRRELGRDIRRGFVARPGWKLLIADYSQIELRLLAHLSHDQAFVHAFSSGGDIHRETAAVIFGVPADIVSSEMRARAKTINFATIYGQGAIALARQLKISNAEAKQFIATYFERFRGVRAYLDEQVAFAREHGYVETIFKRRRYVPELRDRNFNIRAFGERVATNAPIQGSAADLIKIAMIRIHHLLRERDSQSRMILQVHDELVFELHPGELEDVRALVAHEMEHAALLSVPLVVDIGVGDNWLDAKA